METHTPPLEAAVRFKRNRSFVRWYRTSALKNLLMFHKRNVIGGRCVEWVKGIWSVGVGVGLNCLAKTALIF